MADFLRFVTPTYFGGLPAGYELANVISGGEGSGGSAFADDAKVGGPNDGTYFVAFGEDASSSNANRGIKALFKNTDFIDNILRRDLALPVRTNDALAVGAVSSVTLPTGTYLGRTGYTTSTADLARLYSVVDDSDNEILNAGVKVTVTSVTLGAGDTIGGGGANGSFSGNTVQLNLSPSIPSGTNYRVYYGERSSLTSMPNDVFTTIRIRGAEEVPAAVETLFLDLHGGGFAWNAAWSSTIYDLASSGLNDRYSRRTTTSVASPPETYWSLTTLDANGGGGWIVRKGPAVTIYTDGDTTGAYTDPANALLALKFRDTSLSTSGGVVGVVGYGTRKAGSAISGEGSKVPGFATFLGLWSHENTTGMHASNPYTRVPAATACTLTTPDTNVNTGEAVVTLTNAADYFRDGSGNSMIALGYDLLELKYTVSGTVYRKTVVVTAMGSSAAPTDVRKVRVRTLSGNVPDFTSATSATVERWYSLSYGVGDGAPKLHDALFSYTDLVQFDGLHYQVPPNFDSAAGSDVAKTPAGFFGPTISQLTGQSAVRWGGFQYSQPSGPVAAGYLLSSGGLESEDRVRARQLAVFPQVIETIATTANLDLSDGSLVRIDEVTTSTLTINLTNVPETAGGLVTIIITRSSDVALTWGTVDGDAYTHHFSEGDDQPSAGAGTERWDGYIFAAGGHVYWTVTRY